MHHRLESEPHCPVRVPPGASERERGVRAVVALTALMMVLEIVGGYWTGSMALLADGWHMATHVAALGLAAAAYTVARHYAAHRVLRLARARSTRWLGIPAPLRSGSWPWP